MPEQLIYIRLGEYARQRRRRVALYAYSVGLACVALWVVAFLVIARYL